MRTARAPFHPQTDISSARQIASCTLPCLTVQSDTGNRLRMGEEFALLTYQIEEIVRPQRSHDGWQPRSRSLARSTHVSLPSLLLLAAPECEITRPIQSSARQTDRDARSEEEGEDAGREVESGGI